MWTWPNAVFAGWHKLAVLGPDFQSPISANPSSTEKVLLGVNQGILLIRAMVALRNCDVMYSAKVNMSQYSIAGDHFKVTFIC